MTGLKINWTQSHGFIPPEESQAKVKPELQEHDLAQPGAAPSDVALDGVGLDDDYGIFNDDDDDDQSNGESSAASVDGEGSSDELDLFDDTDLSNASAKRARSEDEGKDDRSSNKRSKVTYVTNATEFTRPLLGKSSSNDNRQNTLSQPR